MSHKSSGSSTLLVRLSYNMGEDMRQRFLLRTYFIQIREKRQTRWSSFVMLKATEKWGGVSKTRYNVEFITIQSMFIAFLFLHKDETRCSIIMANTGTWKMRVEEHLVPTLSSMRLARSATFWWTGDGGWGGPPRPYLPQQIFKKTVSWDRLKKVLTKFTELGLIGAAAGFFQFSGGSSDF